MATIGPVTPDFASVNAAVTSASSGDTVLIQAGVGNWGSGDFLNFSKDISIIGAGMDAGRATPSSSNATILNLNHSTGKFIAATFQNTKNTCRISGMVLNLHSYGASYLINLQGRCFRQKDNTGTVVGGLRIDNLRYRNEGDSGNGLYTLQNTTLSGAQAINSATINVVSTTGFLSSGQINVGSFVLSYTGISGNSFTGCAQVGSSSTNTIASGTAVTQNDVISSKALLVQWGCVASGSGSGDYITGSYDHNFLDYIVGSSGSETNNFGNMGNDASVTHSNGWGQYAWFQPYTFGGGDDTELNVVYIEDNIFHKGNFVFGTLGGGARIVCRHNSSWGGITGHGMESGNNMGPASWEMYNNYFDLTVPGVPSAATCCSTRGGAQVIFNNRFTIPSGGAVNDINVQAYRPSASTSGVVGPATGRNFFDLNWRGNIVAGDNVNGGNSYTAETTQALDTRVGSVYAHGTLASSGDVVTAGKVYKLTGSNTDGGYGSHGTDSWKGFVITNTSVLLPGSDLSGDQGQLTSAQNLAYGYITGSTDISTNVVQVTIAGGANGSFNLTNSQNWEIRRVKQYFCAPGAGRIPASTGGTNAGDNANSVPDAQGMQFLTGLANGDGQGNTVTKYWCGQAGFGIWQWGNLVRNSSSTPWSGSSATNLTGNVLAGVFPGGLNNGIPSHNKNDGTGSSYPTILGTSGTLRVGADWSAPNYPNEFIAGTASIPDRPTFAYGSAYPNAMVSGTIVSPPSITSPLTASGTVGVAFSYTITASNGPTLFGVTGTLPAGLGLNTTTGVISGTPAGQPSSYSISISASNSGGKDTETLVITISGTGASPRKKGKARVIGGMGRRSL